MSCVAEVRINASVMKVTEAIKHILNKPNASEKLAQALNVSQSDAEVILKDLKENVPFLKEERTNAILINGTTLKEFTQIVHKAVSEFYLRTGYYPTKLRMNQRVLENLCEAAKPFLINSETYLQQPSFMGLEIVIDGTCSDAQVFLH